MSDEAILATFTNVVDCAVYDHEDGTVRWVMASVDDAGRPLEAVWIELGDGNYLAIHCQKLRKATIDLIRQLKEEA